MLNKVDEDFGIICVCAERYALGRETYMPSVVQEFIKRNIENIDNNSIAVMIRDIESAEDYGRGYGSETIDKPGWMDLLDFLKKYKDKG